MTYPSCRRTVLAVVLLLATLVAVVSPSVALAQAPAGQTVQAPPATRPEARDDDDSGTRSSIGGRARPLFFPTLLLTCDVSVTNGQLHSTRASKEIGSSGRP